MGKRLTFPFISSDKVIDNFYQGNKELVMDKDL